MTSLSYLRKNAQRGTLIENPLDEVAAMLFLQQQQQQQHPNLVPLLDYMMDDDNLYIITPYVSHGDLFERVQATQQAAIAIEDDHQDQDGMIHSKRKLNLGGLSETEARRYLMQIIEGLLFMKSRGVAHRYVWC